MPVALAAWSAGARDLPNGLGRRIEIAPMFYRDAACGSSGGWKLWSSDVHGCFGAQGVQLESRGIRVEIQFSGSAPTGIQAQSAHVHRLTGTAAVQGESRPLYGGLLYRELYPGIDLTYQTVHNSLKSAFLVRPGADPAVIRLRYSGMPSLDSSGNLSIESGPGEMREDAPVAYQEIQGTRVPVRAAFRIQADGSVGFEVGAYDRGRELVIDPPLKFSTVYGGRGYTTINAIAVDAAGNVYFAGCTDSAVAPVISALQSGYHGSNEAIAGKMGPDGRLLYATYLGGSQGDCATGIAVDSTGAAVVAGWTYSADFPVVSAVRPLLRGGRDGFLARISPSGDRLLFSTYFGGTLDDTINGVALDGSGNIYVAGQTDSADLPVMNALQPHLAGGMDAFVAEFTPAGNLVYSTYYGGSFDDFARGIAVSSDGVASIAGGTQSLDLPVVNAIQPRSGGGQDAFVARLERGGASLRYATYLGGSGGSAGTAEFATAIAVDSAGAAYVTGITSSSSFPVAGALFPSALGGIDGFVSKLAPSGSQLIYSTYLGGMNVDLANAIAVDAAGNAYIAGATASADFPSVGLVTVRSSGYDAFVTELDATGKGPILSGFVAGSASDSVNGIALDAAGNIYLAGQTLSVDFPLVNAIGAPTGTGQGTLSAIAVTSAPSPISVSPASGSGPAGRFVFTAHNPGGASQLWRSFAVFSAAGSSAMCYVVLDSGAFYLLNDTATGFSGPVMPGANNSVENSQCRVNALNSSVVNAGAVQTLTVDLVFKSAFAGPKKVSLLLQTKDNQTSSLQALGAWTVTAAPAIGPVAVSPASGSGYTGPFVFTFNDTAGAADLLRALMLFSAPGSSAMCYVMAVAPNSLYLLTDDARSYLGPIVPGTAGAIENGQCRLSGANSSVSNFGNTKTIALDLRFKPPFAGLKNIFALTQTQANQLSPWQALGTWTVTVDPLGNGPLMTLSAALGSGYNARFIVTTTDEDGAADISRTTAFFSAPGSSAMCYVVWVAPNGLYLLNDTATDFLRSVVPGTADTVENSQCRVNAANSSVWNFGQTQALTLDLTFKPAFAGAKNISGLVQTNENLVTSQRALGTWSVGQ